MFGAEMDSGNEHTVYFGIPGDRNHQDNMETFQGGFMGFFSEIKSLFKDDPAGRYLAVVIKKISEHDKDFLPSLFGIEKSRKWSCTTEYSFQRSERRADLAIYEDDDSEPAYLVEVKVRDNKNNDHTRGQLMDYQKWAGVGDRPKVFIISPFGLADDQVKAIKNSKKALAFVDFSRVSFRSKSSFVILFEEYLMDSGYIMKKIDDSRESAFMHFLASAFLPEAAGLAGTAKTSTERVAEGPLVFADIVGNFQLFAQTFPTNPRKPTVKYLFTQRLNPSRIGRVEKGPSEYIFKDDENEGADQNVYSVQRNKKVGGTLEVFARCRLVEDVGYLKIGIFIRISPRTRDEYPISYYPYAAIWKSGRSIVSVQQVIKTGKGFPELLSSQQKASHQFKRLADKLIAKLNDAELAAMVKEKLPSEWWN